jgi:hypothetical protein
MRKAKGPPSIPPVAGGPRRGDPRDLPSRSADLLVLAAVDLECPWRVSVDGMEFPRRSDQRVQVFHPATVSRLTLR